MADPHSPPAVEAAGLAKRFGDIQAVDGVELTVEPGEVRGLLGPNGAGKTTLLRMLLGLVRPGAGSIAFFGRAFEPELAAGELGVAGFVEEPRFYPYLSGRRVLELLARLDGDPRAGRRAPDELLELVDLSRQADRRVGGYSSGMRQRLGLAAALLAGPRLLLLDEPTTGLDPPGARAFRELLGRVAGDGTAVVMASHDMDEVSSVCDGVTIMSGGRVVWDGSIDRLRAEAPAPEHRLATSDDGRALALAAGAPGVAVHESSGFLIVRAERDPLDAFVLALGGAGIAVRRLDEVTSSIEAMFAALTGAELGDPR